MTAVCRARPRGDASLARRMKPLLQKHAMSGSDHYHSRLQHLGHTRVGVASVGLLATVFHCSAVSCCGSRTFPWSLSSSICKRFRKASASHNIVSGAAHPNEMFLNQPGSGPSWKEDDR